MPQQANEWGDKPANEWGDKPAAAPAPKMASSGISGGYGFLSNVGRGVIDSTVRPIVNTVLHPYETAKSTVKQVIGTDQISMIADLVKQRAYKAAAGQVGQYVTEGPGGRIAQGMVDPIAADVKAGEYGHAAGSAIGTAGMLLAGPKLLKGVGEVVTSPAARTVGTAAKGAVVGGARAAVSPRTIVGAGISELAAEHLAKLAGVPPGVVGGVVGGVKVAKGMYRGAKAALAERAASAAEEPTAASPRGTLTGPEKQPSTTEVPYNNDRGVTWNALNRAVHGAAESMGADHNALHNAVAEGGKKFGYTSVADLNVADLKKLYKTLTGEDWKDIPHGGARSKARPVPADQQPVRREPSVESALRPPQ